MESELPSDSLDDGIREPIKILGTAGVETGVLPRRGRPRVKEACWNAEGA